MRSRIKAGIALVSLCTAACVEPYNLPQKDNNSLGYLVVDGYLDGSAGNGTIRLSRSIGLSDYVNSSRETGADVQVELKNGGSFPLAETSDGVYTAANVRFDANASYRLHIATKNGSSYTSDYIKMKVAPELDSVVWRAEEKGIQFYVNSHDDSGETKYYQYRFVETWSYSVAFVSHYKTVGGVPVKRTNKELVHQCWDDRISTNTIVKSVNNLSKDVISMLPIYLIEKGSRKLVDVYCMEVEQRSISEDEYQFWELIRKTNESLGGLFDPIPSRVLGNIACDNIPGESVLGHFSGGFSTKKRLFIKYEDLPESHREIDPLSYHCSTYDLSITPSQPLADTLRVLDLEIPPSVYVVTSYRCGDCRTIGGDTIRPSFWPQ